MITLDVPQMFYSGAPTILAESQPDSINPGQTAWGGWGSNPRPADYESAALTG